MACHPLKWSKCSFGARVSFNDAIISNEASNLRALGLRGKKKKQYHELFVFTRTQKKQQIKFDFNFRDPRG